jgi:hypothetical protein
MTAGRPPYGRATPRTGRRWISQMDQMSGSVGMSPTMLMPQLGADHA